MSIKRVYIGLPEHLKHIVKWSQRRHRKNPLSFVPGGVDIVVEYQDHSAWGYDWVKLPSNYIAAIFKRDFPDYHRYSLDSDMNGMLVFIKEKVNRIFARKVSAENEEQSFIEVWNTASSELPDKALMKFNDDKAAKFLQFFQSHREFALKYISLFYPFTYSEIVENWDAIVKGDAHYSAYLADMDQIISPDFGLCFNQNIRWNSKLRSRWEYGFFNHFEGLVDGTGKGPVEIEEREYLDAIIPLSVICELEVRNDCSVKHWVSTMAPYCDFESDECKGPAQINLELYNKVYALLTYDEFKEIYETNKNIILLNKSIWNNTLQDIIDETFCGYFYKLDDFMYRANSY